MVAAEAGRPTWRRLRSDPPLTLRPTGRHRLHVVGSSAGPVGGDVLKLDLAVGAGARLDVRSAAASIVLPGPHGEASSLTVRADVATRAALDWAPEPTVLVRGCHHRSAT